MNTNTFIFRVDASEKIGTGHLQRCLLLAKYFINKEDWDVIFLTQQTQSEIIINQAGFKCIKVSEKYSSVSDFIKTLNKPAVVLADINSKAIFNNINSYTEYIQSLDKDSEILITFEDLVDYPYPTNIVIIPYVGAEKLGLLESEKVTYLLGPKYFPVRDEFQNSKKLLISKKAKKILVTMGGGDPERITLKVLNALCDLNEKWSIEVILGATSKITNQEVEESLELYDGIYEIINDASNLSTLISNSDLVITNSGLTKYEVSLIGVPSIIISNNKKQAIFSDKFANYGSSMHIGEHNQVNNAMICSVCSKLMGSYPLRSKMSSKGRALIDGNGTDRIYIAIKNIMT